MKKILNRKGFTLIELLAVIIILAVIMVFAVPAIMETSNTAQQKAFQLYAQRVLTKATEYVETQKMLGYVKSDSDNDESFYNIEHTAFSQDTVGLGQASGYGVCIQYDKDATNDAGYKLTLYITNGTYCYISDASDPKKETTDSFISSNLPNKTKCPTVGAIKLNPETAAGANGTKCVVQTSNN